MSNGELVGFLSSFGNNVKALPIVNWFVREEDPDKDGKELARQFRYESEQIKQQRQRKEIEACELVIYKRKHLKDIPKYKLRKILENDFGEFVGTDPLRAELMSRIAALVKEEEKKKQSSAIVSIEQKVYFCFYLFYHRPVYSLPHILLCVRFFFQGNHQPPTTTKTSSRGQRK
jgi:hypothetical protein